MNTDQIKSASGISASPEKLYDMVRLKAMMTGIAMIAPQNAATIALRAELAGKLQQLIDEGKLRKAISDARQSGDRAAQQAAKGALHDFVVAARKNHPDLYPASGASNLRELTNRASRLIKELTAGELEKSISAYLRCNSKAVLACGQAREALNLGHINQLQDDKVAALEDMQRRLDTADPSRQQEADDLRRYIAARIDALNEEIGLRKTLIGEKMEAAAAYARGLDPGLVDIALAKAQADIDRFFVRQRDILKDTYGKDSTIGNPRLHCIGDRIKHVILTKLADLDFTSYSDEEQFNILQNLYTQRGGQMRFGEGEINVIGVRGLDNRGDRKGKVGGETAGQYDDTIFVLVTQGGVRHVYSFPATTQPGNTKDEIVAKGIYDYVIGTHNPEIGPTQYDVGRENGISASKRAFWDTDGDGRLNDSEIWTRLGESGEIDITKLGNTNDRGRGGFNIHAGNMYNDSSWHMGEWAYVGTWSTGCQVIPSKPIPPYEPPYVPTDGVNYFETFRDLLRVTVGDRKVNEEFKYALVDVRDLVQVINGGQITESNWLP